MGKPARKRESKAEVKEVKDKSLLSSRTVVISVVLLATAIGAYVHLSPLNKSLVQPRTKAGVPEKDAPKKRKTAKSS